MKSARRAERRALRRDLDATRDVAVDDDALPRHVVALVDSLGLGAGSVVTSYVSIPGEPPTPGLNAALTARGITVLLPITLPDLDLDWFELSDAAMTPLGLTAIERADLVLAPGLAVDRTGTRLGQGGGCYDKALPRRRPGTPVVVVLHPGEVVEDAAAPLPREAHDQPVDAVVTAEGLLDLGLSPWRRPTRA